MKKLFVLSAFAVFLMIAKSSLCQIIITKSDMPKKGDTVRVSLGLNPEIIDLSETGENYNWDYSGLIPIKQRVDTFFKVLDTPGGIMFLWTSDFAVRMGALAPLPGVEISDAYQYYKSSSDAYKNTGFAFSIQGFPIPASFSNPDIIYRFPMEYSNSDSSSSGIDMGIPNTGYLKVDRHRTNHVDGWGTLTTPYGTFDVIRVKSHVTEYDSIYLDSQETGIAIPYSYTEYKWLAKNQKIPLLTVLEFTQGAIAEYTDSIRSTLGIVEKSKLVSDINIYPNPVKSDANVNFYLKQQNSVTISIVDILGKTVWKSEIMLLNSGNHSIKINMPNLTLGTYFVNIATGNQNSTSKIIYQP